MRPSFLRSRRGAVLIAAIAAAAVVAGCGGGSSSTETTKKPGNTLPATTLNGSGSTFVAAFYDEVFKNFTDNEQPNVTVNYNPVGSGQGQTDLQGGLVDFAGSDSLVKPADVSKFKGAFLYIPTVSAPITVSYHLSGVKSLRLSPATIAKIFSAKVTTWDAPAIAADNPGVKLPGTQITVVHRNDGSGTTANFTKFLAKAAPSDWTLGSDKTVPWPGSTVGAEKNTGVGGKVKNTEGAIGYVDYSDARAIGLSFASIRNAAGKFVAPTLDGATAAVAGATVNDDLTFDPLDTSGADVYPITAPTFMLVYEKVSDTGKAKALRALLEYVLGPGQDQAADLDYARLPDSLLAKARTQIAKVGSA